MMHLQILSNSIYLNFTLVCHIESEKDITSGWQISRNSDIKNIYSLGAPNRQSSNSTTLQLFL